MIIDVTNTNIDTTIETASTDNNRPRKNHKNTLIKFIDILVDQFSVGIKLIGPFFSFALFVFKIFVIISFFETILPYWRARAGMIFSIFLVFLLIFLMINIFVNYFLAVLVKPGSPEDIMKYKKYKDKSPYLPSEEFLSEVDLSYFKKGLKSVEYSSKCNKCNKKKPLRAHHCQTCGLCVMKMDHHCPWINNCVGQNNQRYFVLFLTHTLIGCVFISILITPIFFFKNVDEMPTHFNFVCVLCLTGSLLLTVFNIWNWFLVLNGNTTIEYFSSQLGSSDISKLDYSMNTLSENIYMVFGTKSLIKIFLFPDLKMLPFSGMEWTRILDNNFFYQDGDTVDPLSENVNLI
jgi:hypothetical protein